jgi:hypothetical protein
MDKVNQKMRRFNLRGVLIGLRATVGSSPQKTDVGIEETLRSEHFQVAKVGRRVVTGLRTMTCRRAE